MLQLEQGSVTSHPFRTNWPTNRRAHRKITILMSPILSHNQYTKLFSFMITFLWWCKVIYLGRRIQFVATVTFHFSIYLSLFLFLSIYLSIFSILLHLCFLCWCIWFFLRESPVIEGTTDVLDILRDIQDANREQVHILSWLIDWLIINDWLINWYMNENRLIGW